ncbi:molybdenum cofactor guanylyltransferase MobA [Sulfurospirillum sp. 1612]|uniref:molybdenum cofactor guanylyltransferase MobA n=1 Tax=Sulfurospirillum sp. 1612 TaxID=3094835 RepID=UPI002F94E4B4
MIIPLPCVIIAGGKSSRMGSDKALLPFGGFSTLTEYQIQRNQSAFQALYVSCKDRSKFDFDANFIEDVKTFEAYSPLVALYSIMTKLQTPICVLSVDTPFVTSDIYKKMYDVFDHDSDAVIARTGERTQQLCAIYSCSLLPKIEENLNKNQHKIQNLFENSNIKYLDIKDSAPFLNLNRQEDYQHALALMKESQS